MHRLAVPTPIFITLILLVGCAEQMAPRGAVPAQRDHESAVQIQIQTALMRAEIDGLRSALLEKDRRESELWRGYFALMAQVNQLLEAQQRAQRTSDTFQDTTELPPPPTHAERPMPVKTLIRAINRLELSPEQKQALIQLLSPPRPIDSSNPWKSEGTW